MYHFIPTKNLRCRRCGNLLIEEAEAELRETYPYVCLHCDENMFSFEAASGKDASCEELADLKVLFELNYETIRI